MTPDVPRLREIGSSYLRMLHDNLESGSEAPKTVLAALIRHLGGFSLLSDAPPDGAAEREADEGYRLECGRCEGSGQFPEGRTCLRCGGNGYDPVQPKPTPAPTEAPAAGDAPDRFKNVSCVIQSGGGYGPRLIWSFDSLDDAHDAHRLFRAALAARPAAVTDEMVEAACVAQHGADAWQRLLATEPPIARAERKAAHDMLAAALAARGPA